MAANLHPGLTLPPALVIAAPVMPDRAEPKLSPVYRGILTALWQSAASVVGTLADMARFPLVTLGMTTLLGLPEVGAEMALVQGIAFVPSVSGLYALSNILSVRRGEGYSTADLAAVRRAGDIFSLRLAGFSAFTLLFYGYLPLSRSASQEALIRKFLFTYFPGTLPALWVIVRQEDLTAHGQLWSLAALNFMSLFLMAGVSYGLLEVMEGWSLGASLTLSSVLSLVLFECFLHKSSQHRNSFFSRMDFSDSIVLRDSFRELAAKAKHSALVFIGSYLAMLSTILVQFFKNPEPHNIANGMLNQAFYLVIVPGVSIAQTLVANSIGNTFGELSKLADVDRQHGRAFNVASAKNRLYQNLMISTLVSFAWPALLAVIIYLLKDRTLKFLTSGTSEAVFKKANQSFEDALMLGLFAGTANIAQNMFLAAKRTINRESKFDSSFQFIAGTLTFAVVAGVIFGTNPTGLVDIWLPIFFINYMAPCLAALITTLKAFKSLNDLDFSVNVGPGLPGEGQVVGRRTIELADFAVPVADGDGDQEEKGEGIERSPSAGLAFFGSSQSSQSNRTMNLPVPAVRPQFSPVSPPLISFEEVPPPPHGRVPSLVAMAIQAPRSSSAAALGQRSFVPPAPSSNAEGSAPPLSRHFSG
jgi:hypothetical protein